MMDPTEALTRIREQLELVERAPSLARANDHRERVCLAVRELDVWLSSGGFPPAQWGNLTTKPEPIRVKDVDEMLDLLAPDPWRTAANVLGVNVPPTMEDEARAELERRGDA